jgi:hypothetical protein
MSDELAKQSERGEKTKQELLKRAANLVGRDNLAIALKVPQHLLDAWMSGQATMPARKLVALAGYLDEITQPRKQ